MPTNDTLTAIPGLSVGHAQDEEALTGCTVILCEGGATGGVDQRGGAPGTRETDPLHPMHLVQQVHAIVLSGGSAFGLDAATGAVRFLEEQGIGFPTPAARVPIVPAAILYDLGLGRADVRPDAKMGYQACRQATTEPVLQGNVGAGCGASVGKILGMEGAMKAGLGSAARTLDNDLRVGVLVAVNALGDVRDPAGGGILAGARRPEHEEGPAANIFADTVEVMAGLAEQGAGKFGAPPNTVIGIVATNARLTKEEVNKVAQMAHDGLARAVRPAHTMFDGDTIFALSTGELEADVTLVGALGADLFAESVIRAVKSASSAGGLPAWMDFHPNP